MRLLCTCRAASLHARLEAVSAVLWESQAMKVAVNQEGPDKR